jgi:uncharacterized protein YbaP (TraB family)
MKRLFHTAAVLMVFSAMLHSQLLWQVKSASSKSPSYIFVTHSLIPIRYLDSIPGLLKTFSRCDVVIGEIALNSVDDMTKIQQAAVLPPDMTLADLLDLNEFTAVDNELKSTLEIGLSELARLHPAMILTLYKTKLFEKATGFVEGSQSESYFQFIALQQDKKVSGLESADVQIEVLFGNTPPERGARLLVDAVSDKDGTLARMLAEVRLYKSGDVEALYSAIRQNALAGFPSAEGYDDLLKQRNAAWGKQLLEYVKAAPCFITVGAEHLPGRYGLLNLLREGGYSVTPMKVK